MGKIYFSILKSGLITVICMACFVCFSQKMPINDFSVSKEKNGFILKIDGLRFDAGTDNSPYSWLCIPEISRTVHTHFAPPANCYFAARYIKDIKIAIDTDSEKVVYIKVNAYDIDNKKSPDHPFYMEINLRIKKDIPCLFVHQRVMNLSDVPKFFRFGNYTRNFIEYAGTDLKIMPVSSSMWTTLCKGNYFWAKGENNNSKGIGIIAFSATNFITDGRNIYWGNCEGLVEESACLETKWAIFTAQNPEEVKKLYEKLKEMKFDFVVPE